MLWQQEYLSGLRLFDLRKLFLPLTLLTILEILILVLEALSLTQLLRNLLYSKVQFLRLSASPSTSILQS